MGTRHSFLSVALRSVWIFVFPQSLLSTHPLLHEEMGEPARASCRDMAPLFSLCPFLGCNLGRFPPCHAFLHMRGCACKRLGGAWAQQVHTETVFGPLGHGGACDEWRPSWCLPTMLSHSSKAPASTKGAEHAHRRPPAWSSFHRCEVPLKSCILSQK